MRLFPVRMLEVGGPAILGAMRRNRIRVALGLVAILAGSSCRGSPWPGPEATREALIALHGEVRARVLAGDFARADGFA